MGLDREPPHADVFDSAAQRAVELLFHERVAVSGLESGPGSGPRPRARARRGCTAAAGKDGFGGRGGDEAGGCACAGGEWGMTMVVAVVR